MDELIDSSRGESGVLGRRPVAKASALASALLSGLVRRTVAPLVTFLNVAGTGASLSPSVMLGARRLPRNLSLERRPVALLARAPDVPARPTISLSISLRWRTRGGRSLVRKEPSTESSATAL
eukprot:5030557-Prymnesium_polylepis.2